MCVCVYIYIYIYVCIHIFFANTNTARSTSFHLSLSDSFPKMSPWPGCGPPAVAQHTQHTQGRQTRREANNPSKADKRTETAQAEQDSGSALLQLLAVPEPKLGSWLFLGCLGMTPLIKFIETPRGNKRQEKEQEGNTPPSPFLSWDPGLGIPTSSPFIRTQSYGEGTYSLLGHEARTHIEELRTPLRVSQSPR